jgi:hypothetical protein
MTIQTKHFIELSDLVALRLVCKHCGATLSLLLSDDKLAAGENSLNTFLSTCPSCHREWAELGGSTYEPTIRKATAALNRLKGLLYGELAEPLGFSLTLEIKPEAMPDQKYKP